LVSVTMARLHRIGRRARPKLAARIGILRCIIAAIPDDLRGLRDRALLLVGFAVAFRRSELAHCEGLHRTV
jgi:hypothetical protein